MFCDIGAHQPAIVADDAGHAAVRRAAASHSDDIDGQPGHRAITATALSLFHELDATLMILFWNLGTAVMFIGLAGAFCHKMFSWVAPHSMQL